MIQAFYTFAGYYFYGFYFGFRNPEPWRVCIR